MEVNNESAEVFDISRLCGDLDKKSIPLHEFNELLQAWVKTESHRQMIFSFARGEKKADIARNNNVDRQVASLVIARFQGRLRGHLIDSQRTRLMPGEEGFWVQKFFEAFPSKSYAILGSRASNALWVEHRESTVMEFVSTSEAELRKIPNCGRVGVEKISEFLSANGLFIGMTSQDIENMSRSRTSAPRLR